MAQESTRELTEAESLHEWAEALRWRRRLTVRRGEDANRRRQEFFRSLLHVRGPWET